MTKRQVAGRAILATPFIAMFVGFSIVNGFWPTVGVFAGVAVAVGLILVGVNWTMGD